MGDLAKEIQNKGIDPCVEALESNWSAILITAILEITQSVWNQFDYWVVWWWWRVLSFLPTVASETAGTAIFDLDVFLIGPVFIFVGIVVFMLLFWTVVIPFNVWVMLFYIWYSIMMFAMTITAAPEMMWEVFHSGIGIDLAKTYG